MQEVFSRVGISLMADETVQIIHTLTITQTVPRDTYGEFTNQEIIQFENGMAIEEVLAQAIASDNLNLTHSTKVKFNPQPSESD
jgi:S-adenosylmethionine/arginine decarboxylase-like enzyme